MNDNGEIFYEAWYQQQKDLEEKVKASVTNLLEQTGADEVTLQFDEHAPGMTIRVEETDSKTKEILQTGVAIGLVRSKRERYKFVALGLLVGWFGSLTLSYIDRFFFS